MGRSRRCFKETEAAQPRSERCHRAGRRSRRCFKETEAVKTNQVCVIPADAAVAAVSRRLRRSGSPHEAFRAYSAAVAAVSRRLRRQLVLHIVEDHRVAAVAAVSRRLRRDYDATAKTTRYEAAVAAVSRRLRRLLLLALFILPKCRSRRCFKETEAAHGPSTLPKLAKCRSRRCFKETEAGRAASGSLPSSAGRSRRCFKETEADARHHRFQISPVGRSRRCFKETEAVWSHRGSCSVLLAALAAVSKSLNPNQGRASRPCASCAFCGKSTCIGFSIKEPETSSHEWLWIWWL